MMTMISRFLLFGYMYILLLHSLATAEPLQLVYPDESHRFLQINETACAILEQQVPDPVWIVAAAGPVHSGKSFLLNRLMKKQKAFPIGNTVAPKTRGIQVWSEPVSLYLEAQQLPTLEDVYSQDVDIRNDDVPVKTVEFRHRNFLAMDTEGLAADANDLYDAKIFSLATLLSSVTLWNTVKTIDRSSIDQVELLGHQTQLFAARAGFVLGDSKLPMQDAKRQLFPHFVWLTQDFVSRLGEGHQNATDWLLSLLALPHHRIDDVVDPYLRQSSLQDLFLSLHAYTMFIPHAEKHLLLDLDEATEYSPHYMNDLRLLHEHLVQLLRNSPKQPMNGKTIVALLKWWVHASNAQEAGGIYPRPVDTWETFRNVQTQISYDSVLNNYRTTMRAVLRSEQSLLNASSPEQLLKYTSQVLNLQTFRVLHTVTKEKEAFALQNQLKGFTYYPQDDPINPSVHKGAPSLLLLLSPLQRLEKEIEQEWDTVFQPAKIVQLKWALMYLGDVCLSNSQKHLEELERGDAAYNLANDTVLDAVHHQVFQSHLKSCWDKYTSALTSFSEYPVYFRNVTSHWLVACQQTKNRVHTNINHFLNQTVEQIRSMVKTHLDQEKQNIISIVNSSTSVIESYADTISGTWFNRVTPFLKHNIFPFFQETYLKLIKDFRQDVQTLLWSKSNSKCELARRQAALSLDSKFTLLPVPMEKKELLQKFHNIKLEALEMFKSSVGVLLEEYPHCLLRLRDLELTKPDNLIEINMLRLNELLITPVNDFLSHVAEYAKSYRNSWFFVRDMKARLTTVLLDHLKQAQTMGSGTSLDLEHSELVDEFAEYIMKKPEIQSHVYILYHNLGANILQGLVIIVVLGIILSLFAWLFTALKAIFNRTFRRTPLS